MKKDNLTLKEGLVLLKGGAYHNGKLRHIELNKNRADTDCYVVYNTAIGNYQHHIWYKESHIVSLFIPSNFESYSDVWVYEDDVPEVDEPQQPNHIKYKDEIEYLLKQTSERALIDSLLDYMSVSDVDEWLKTFVR